VSDRPTIGITASVEMVTSGDWEELSAAVPFTYVRAVQRAGGRAILLVPDDRDAREPDRVLDLVDGLIVSGAAGDVDPAHYGEAAHPSTRPVVAERDDLEMSLVRAAAARDMPVLGICRGMHVINVAYGGTLEQHLADVLETDGHRGPPGEFTDHEVDVEAGSIAARAAGARRTSVRSYHHQGVREVGDGLRATAWADGDGVVEAIEDPQRRFVLGVAWHPEEDEASRVIGALVEEAHG
jgi:putative glutamine amidotransferase